MISLHEARLSRRTVFRCALTSGLFFAPLINTIMDTAYSQTSQNQSAEQAILENNARLERIGSGFKFTEGPVWTPQNDLLFSDIPADTIYSWSNGKTEVFRLPSRNSNGLTFDAKGHLLACEHGSRRVSLTENDGTVRVLADAFEGKKLNSPNDLVVKSDGSIYFTDPPYGIKSEQEEQGFSGIYRIAPDGKLSLLDKSQPRPNGLAFSPDEKRLYLNDSQENLIYVFDVNTDGTIANKRVLADVKQQGLNGAVDGMKVNANGEIVTSGPGGVCVVASDGKLLGRIRVPEVTTNVAFGDRDRKTLFITAGSTVYRIRMKTAGLPLPYQK